MQGPVRGGQSLDIAILYEIFHCAGLLWFIEVPLKYISCGGETMPFMAKFHQTIANWHFPWHSVQQQSFSSSNRYVDSNTRVILTVSFGENSGPLPKVACTCHNMNDLGLLEDELSVVEPCLLVIVYPDTCCLDNKCFHLRPMLDGCLWKFLIPSAFVATTTRVATIFNVSKSRYIL